MRTKVFFGVFFVIGVALVSSPAAFAEEVASSTDDVASVSTATSTDAGSDDEDEDKVTPTTTTKKNIHNAAAVEKEVREFFEDTPVMIEIARCESKFRQYADSGNVFRGGLGNGMVGIFQFHERIHANMAKSLGYDLATLDGNLKYARHLYRQSGTDPWISSFSCWNTKKGGEDAKEKNPATLSVDLIFGQTHPQVRTLQEFLNKAGYMVADSGPGSPGNETTIFGALTRAALRKFQCSEKIACFGDEYSTGYGLAGIKTRAKLAVYESKDKKVEEPEKKTASTKQATKKLSAKERAALEVKLTELLKMVAELQKQLALL